MTGDSVAFFQNQLQNHVVQAEFFRLQPIESPCMRGAGAERIWEASIVHILNLHLPGPYAYRFLDWNEVNHTVTDFSGP